MLWSSTSFGTNSLVFYDVKPEPCGAISRSNTKVENTPGGEMVRTTKKTWLRVYLSCSVFFSLEAFLLVFLFSR